MELCRVEICKGTVTRSSRLSQSPATQSASPDWLAEDKRERCTQRVEEWFRRNKKWQRESTESDWERERESVFDSTKTALRFHYSFSCDCWISECLFTLSAHERQRQTQKRETRGRNVRTGCLKHVSLSPIFWGLFYKLVVLVYYVIISWVLNVKLYILLIQSVLACSISAIAVCPG